MGAANTTDTTKTTDTDNTSYATNATSIADTTITTIVSNSTNTTNIISGSTISNTSLDFLECKICNNFYDEKDHRPRNGPCGHEFCTACLRLLIQDNTFVCPKCRQKSKVAVAEDLTINFGLIDAIRAFETNKSKSRATHDEVCQVHSKTIAHHCLQCQLWICDDCLDSHCTITGCSTITSFKAMNKMKEKHTTNTDMLLNIFDDDANYLGIKIQEHTDKKMEHLKKAKKHDEEIKHLHNLIEVGHIQRKNLLESKNQLNLAHSPYMLSTSIEVLTQRQQSLRSWSVKNLGTDTPLGLPKALREEKDVYVETIIKNEKRHAKLSQQEENIYVHSFQAQSLVDDCISVPFNRMQKMIPKETSLVFWEMSLNEEVKGRMHIRLENNLPIIRDIILQIVTGQQGPYLRNHKMYCKHNYDIQAYSSRFSEMPVTLNNSEKTVAKRGDVIGYFGSGYLSYIYIYLATSPITYDYGNKYCVFGKLEDGLEVIQACADIYNTKGGNMRISDCGLVIEQE
ncbi:unnamed protein product [Meganyctiphanes norvegica]|uniref:RING-type domain-containing protein n=1 Tax=Meganyctiphanes norvegica TaxID=48144 RepID=A0AAV2S6I4_MEGNR